MGRHRRAGGDLNPARGHPVAPDHLDVAVEELGWLGVRARPLREPTRFGVRIGRDAYLSPQAFVDAEEAALWAVYVAALVRGVQA